MPTVSRIALIAGARPNYMKVFPLLKEIQQRAASRIRPMLIHTGQHYDALMNDVFFEDFGVPRPDHFLGVGSGPHGAQTGRVMIALEALLQQERPDALVVVGDVNSTMAGALVAVKMGIPVAHLEAGLRSGDRTMPEEINRIVTDSISDLLLTSCRDADGNLRGEGIPPEKIRFVGNIMIDSLVQILPRAGESPVLQKLGLPAADYCLVTLHRPSNVDDPPRLRLILDQLAAVAEVLSVVFPLHPRTRKQMAALPSSDQFNRQAEAGRLRLLEPLGYLDFLALESKAAVVLTDSGGVQEETSYLGIPCLTLRPNTERPVTVTQGTNRLVDLATRDLRASVQDARQEMAGRPRRQIEYWDGHTAQRVVDALAEVAC